MPQRFPQAKPVFTPFPAPTFAVPTISFWSRLIGKAERIREEAAGKHREAMAAWEAQETLGRSRHAAEVGHWQKAEKDFWEEHEVANNAFLAEQAEANAKIDALRMSVSAGDPEAVVEHASLVLEASDYDGLFEKSYEVRHRPEDCLLLVSFGLPAPDALPAVKSVRFLKVTGEMKETLISERDRKANFGSVAYQICLRTLHELFEADVDRNIDRILFNGLVEYVDPRIGQEARACLLSVLVDRASFEAIDLARVDPKACFKSLKGVSAATLASLTAVPPVMEMDREDRRFIEGRDVAQTLDEGTNLASHGPAAARHLVAVCFPPGPAERPGADHRLHRIDIAFRRIASADIRLERDPMSGDHRNRPHRADTCLCAHSQSLGLRDGAYVNVGSEAGDDRSWTYWWNQRRGVCLSVATMNGRYDSIVSTPAPDCRRGRPTTLPGPVGGPVNGRPTTLPGPVGGPVASGRTETIRFDRGASSATRQGTVSGYETVTYLIDLRAGQTFTVNLRTSNPSSYFNVSAPRANQALFIGSTSGNRYQGRTAVSGTYKIEVYLMRNAARRGERANYTLNVGAGR